jgi:hypothetical protein
MYKVQNPIILSVINHRRNPLQSTIYGRFISVPVANSDVHNATKRLRPTKSVGLDGIPSFVIKGCSEIFAPIVKFIFNLSLFQNNFPNLWKQAAIVPVCKKGKASSVGNYRPIAIPNHFSTALEFIIHDHVSHILKYKSNPSWHDFIKSKSTVTNLVIFLDFVTLIVCPQVQTDSNLF